MEEDFNDAIKAAAEGVAKGLGEQVPVYKDLLQPAAKEIGVGLKNFVKLALSPLTATIWSFDQIADWVTSELTAKLKDTSPENIVTPKPYIFCPSIESLRYLESEFDLREMFANLIAKSMMKTRQEEAHPSYVEIIKNLSSTDAKILKLIQSQRPVPFFIIYQTISDGKERKLGPYYSPKLYEVINWPVDNLERVFANLIRLGLIEYGRATDWEDQYSNKYWGLENLEKQLHSEDGTIARYVYCLTPLGTGFREVCIDDIY